MCVHFQTYPPVVVDRVTPMRIADPATAIGGVDLAVLLEVESRVDVYFNSLRFRINHLNIK